MEERIKYKKQKYVYSARCQGGEHDLIFPNIKAMVRWFEASTLFPEQLDLDYNSLVDCLRRKKHYGIHVGSYEFTIKQLAVVGVFVNSSKRAKSGVTIDQGGVEYNKSNTYVRGRYSCELDFDGVSFRLCIDGLIQGTGKNLKESKAWVDEQFTANLIESGVVG
jgi:hypothetical protein